jgi:hypothetical protein
MASPIPVERERPELATITVSNCTFAIKLRNFRTHYEPEWLGAEKRDRRRGAMELAGDLTGQFFISPLFQVATWRPGSVPREELTDQRRLVRLALTHRRVYLNSETRTPPDVPTASAAIVDDRPLDIAASVNRIFSLTNESAPRVA